MKGGREEEGESERREIRRAGGMVDREDKWHVCMYV